MAAPHQCPADSSQVPLSCRGQWAEACSACPVSVCVTPGYFFPALPLVCQGWKAWEIPEYEVHPRIILSECLSHPHTHESRVLCLQHKAGIFPFTIVFTHFKWVALERDSKTKCTKYSLKTSSFHLWQLPTNFLSLTFILVIHFSILLEVLMPMQANVRQGLLHPFNTSDRKLFIVLYSLPLYSHWLCGPFCHELLTKLHTPLMDFRVLHHVVQIASLMDPYCLLFWTMLYPVISRMPHLTYVCVCQLT